MKRREKSVKCKRLYVYLIIMNAASFESVGNVYTVAFILLRVISSQFYSQDVGKSYKFSILNAVEVENLIGN